MSRLFFAVSITGLLGAGVAGIVAGCGTSETGIADEDAGDSSGSSSSGMASSSGGSSSGASSGGTDGGDGGGGGDGGSQATPDSVKCGAANCNTAQNEQCCLNYTDGGTNCQQNQCPNNAMQIECDDEADCNGGDVCCLSGNAGQGFTATCQNDCQGLEPRLCQTNAECGDGGVCGLKSCYGKQLKVCGSPFVCN